MTYHSKIHTVENFDSSFLQMLKLFNFKTYGQTYKFEEKRNSDFENTGLEISEK